MRTVEGIVRMFLADLEVSHGPAAIEEAVRIAKTWLLAIQLEQKEKQQKQQKEGDANEC